VISTGTPDGVGPAVTGDRYDGRMAGVGSITLAVGPAA
jgi:fumarylpyruvate hydrolase